MVFLPPHDGPLQCVDDNLGFAKDSLIDRLMTTDDRLITD